MLVRATPGSYILKLSLCCLTGAFTTSVLLLQSSKRTCIQAGLRQQQLDLVHKCANRE